MIFKSNKLCVQRKCLAPWGVFSELYSKLTFAENILSFTPSVRISRGGYKPLCYMLFLVWSLSFSLEDWLISDTSRQINRYR